MRNDDFCSNIDEFATTVIASLKLDVLSIDWERFNSVININGEQLFVSAGFAPVAYESWRDEFCTALARVTLELRALCLDVDDESYFDLVDELFDRALMRPATDISVVSGRFQAALLAEDAGVLRECLIDNWECADKPAGRAPASLSHVGD